MTAEDRRKAAGVRSEAAGVSMVYEKSAETELERIVQEMAQSGEGRELLEVIQKALIQADSGELEIAEKYSASNTLRDNSQTHYAWRREIEKYLEFSCSTQCVTPAATL